MSNAFSFSRHVMHLFLAAISCAGLTSQAQATDWNFESGTLSGWTKTGTAFEQQPTLGNNIVARIPGSSFSLQGRYFVGTFEDRHDGSVNPGSSQGEGPMGTLTSDLFTLSGTQISFLIGGGADSLHEYVALYIKATPENRTRFTVDPRDPDTGVSVPFPTVSFK